MVSWEMASCFFALLAIIVAVCFYIRNLRWNSYRYLADVYYEILKMGMEHPDFLNPEKTRKYKEIWGPDSKEFFRYGAYAHMCWAHAVDIFGAEFSKETLKKLYAPTFERYNTLHGVWLRDNGSTFLGKSFLKFVKSNKWRGYYPDDPVVDKLIWDNVCYYYDESVLSPFSDVVDNPIFDRIAELVVELGKDNVVADFGCGTGKLVEILSKEFNKVYGIDHSENMLRMAIKRCASPNVEYKNMEMMDLSKLYKKIDIAFSINSILPRNPDDTPEMIKEIYKTLKPGGRFIAILPSFDAVLHLKKLWSEDCFNKLERKREAKRRNNFPYSIANWFKKEKNKWEAKRKTYSEFRERKLNETKHLYAGDFGIVQRFIHEEEIQGLLGKAGFKKILYKAKVKYPWKLCEKYNYGYFPISDEENEEIWDWFVVAKKEIQGLLGKAGFKKILYKAKVNDEKNEEIWDWLVIAKK